MKKTINVIIADDSKVSTQLLHAILTEDPNIKVIACASDGRIALELTKKLKPDLVTLDIFMPNMNGVQATRAIMEQCPTPIIIISSHANETETTFVFDALQAGALAIIEKPRTTADYDFNKAKRHILNAVRTLANVQVTRRIGQVTQKPEELFLNNNQLDAKILVLGSSTGGPTALNYILASLPSNFPIPIVIAQHITEGFLAGLVTWLQRGSRLTLKVATNNCPLQAGVVYFAPDNTNLNIIKGRNAPQAMLELPAVGDNFHPSIDTLFTSVAASYPGTAIGGLLTGMGKDGAQGLLQMKESGCTTFSQSKTSCVIYGMPAAAVALNANNYSIDLEKIPQFLTTLIKKEGK